MTCRSGPAKNSGGSSASAGGHRDPSRRRSPDRPPQSRRRERRAMRRGVSTQDALWEMLSTDHLELLPRDASDGLRMRELMAGRGTPAMKFTVILAPEMDGGYSVICPAVPGRRDAGADRPGDPGVPGGPSGRRPGLDDRDSADRRGGRGRCLMSRLPRVSGREAVADPEGGPHPRAIW